ncbi:hypothetical protein BJ165DRAFT_1401333 [Panaeolus papilionaceus]|nr:hypothetical protein BJ165DRAFT_1401333 [Panaeolus papilionaceus]
MAKVQKCNRRRVVHLPFGIWESLVPVAFKPRCLTKDAFKRSTTARSTDNQCKPKSTSVHHSQLADQLATRLVIDGGKGKQKEEENDQVTMKLSAMKAVNASSQTPSGIVQAGWKKSAKSGIEVYPFDCKYSHIDMHETSGYTEETIS